jgi:hypothetical protein
MKKYDVAISFAGEDKWLALDIYNLLDRRGISCYCSADKSDQIYGDMRDNLVQIYDESLINIMIHSEAYLVKKQGSLPFMEQERLFLRHIGKSELKSLYILKADSKEVASKFESCTSHFLKDEGVTGVEKHLFERLVKLKRSKDIDGFTYRHPPKTEQSRGAMTPCSFRISKKFENDKRWREYGDILVNVELAHRGLIIGKGIRTYLIPSGDATVFLGHTQNLKYNPYLLQTKQEYSKKFIATYAEDQLLSGVIFEMRNDSIAYPTVYLNKYDRLLNQSWNER